METKAYEKHFEEWATEKWPEKADRAKNEWLLAAVRAHTRWGQGREVTRADFEAVVEEVSGIQLGGGPPPELAK